MRFDFATFDLELARAIRSLHAEIDEQDLVDAVAIYSDEGAMTVGVAMNSEANLAAHLAAHASGPNTWLFDEWSHPCVESPKLGELSDMVAAHTMAIAAEDFEKFRDELFKSLVNTLAALPFSREPNRLLFTLSDFDNPEKEMAWIEALNPDEIVDEYKNWLEQWN